LLLGSTRNEGLPMELFATGEPRWLGIQFQRAGEAEQPRVLLASVPYALKAGDAETLGGRPASSYVLNPSDIPYSIRKSGTLFLHNIGTENTALGLSALAVSTGTGNTAAGS